MQLWHGLADDGSPISVGDPMAERLRALAGTHAGDVSATVRAIGTLTEVWGPMLTCHETWLAKVQTALQGLRAQGVRACLAASQA